MRLLGSHAVLSSELAERLRRAVGFRNVLAHDYVEVDDNIVLARLADTSDLGDFVRRRRRRLAGSGRVLSTRPAAGPAWCHAAPTTRLGASVWPRRVAGPAVPLRP